MRCSSEASTGPDRAVAAFAEIGVGPAETLRTISRKPHKATYLLECKSAFYVVSCYDETSPDAIQRRDCALAHMRLCAPLALAPEPLPGDKHRNVIIYAFIEGAPVSSDLPSTYRTLGAFSARLHGSARPDGDVPMPRLMDRFQSAAVKESIRETAENLNGLEPGRLLHGDLNASNVLATHDNLIALDFDDTGVGPAELELAIALAYVNTCGQDVQACYHALRDGYRGAGGRLNEDLLRSLVQIAPWYLLSSQMRDASSRTAPAEILRAVETQCAFLSNAVRPT